MTVVSQLSRAVEECWPEWGAATAHVLHRHPSGDSVAQMTLPAEWQINLRALRTHTYEILVLEGSLEIGSSPLDKWGYAHVPHSCAVPFKSQQGATVVIFADRPRPTDGMQLRLVTTAPDDWRPGAVASRDTGRSLALMVRDLYRVSITGQRTWLLKASADLVLPYERHRTIEEGYIIQGRYRLIECLPSGEAQFDHEPGGYFWRPPGIIHGGPKSGSNGDFVMLLRTPEALTVEFVEAPSSS